MNLKIISNEQVIERLQKLVQTERKITHLILECINEIEIRKIHLERGYSSVFDFLTKKMGYTPSAAQRRIDGARLLRQIPEIAQKIEEGALNLSQMVELQRSIRTKQKETSEKITSEKKKEILENVSHKNAKETQTIIARELNLEVPTQPEKIRHHQDESTTVTLHFKKEEMEVIKQVRDLKTNATGSTQIKEFILYLVQRELKKYHQNKVTSQKLVQNKNESRTFTTASAVKVDSCVNTRIHDKINDEIDTPVNTSQNTPQDTPQNTPQDTSQNTSINVTVNSSRKISKNIPSNISKNIPKSIPQNVPKSVYKQILKPGSCCEYIDPNTNKKCGSRVFLSVDHIQPRWADGDHSVENLRVFCKNHNIFRYQKQAGYVSSGL